MWRLYNGRAWRCSCRGGRGLGHDANSSSWLDIRTRTRCIRGIARSFVARTCICWGDFLLCRCWTADVPAPLTGPMEGRPKYTRAFLCTRPVRIGGLSGFNWIIGTANTPSPSQPPPAPPRGREAAVGWTISAKSNGVDCVDDWYTCAGLGNRGTEAEKWDLQFC